MPNTCVVRGCRNRSDPSVKRGFYRFPKIRVHEGSKTEELSRQRRETWIERMNRKDFVPTDYSKVCSDHFVEGKPADLYQLTHPDWAPSLKMNVASQETAGRHLKREKRLAAMALLDLSESAEDTDDSPQSSPLPVDESYPTESRVVSFQDKPSTTTSMDDQDAASLHRPSVPECQRLATEDLEVEEKLLQKKITEESFRDDVKMVQIYTGLPSFFTLMAVFDFVEPHISDSKKIDLTKFEKLVLTLMRLRLNVSMQDLADRFQTSQSTVSRVFLNVVNALYVPLKSLICWPEREQLRQAMPTTFRKCFGERVAVIVDCLEILIERPSDLVAHTQSWSSNKHHNTVKFLIGVTPQGSVSFVSEAWGGRANDKHVTENCGLLEKLLPGDIVMADRGFNIMGSVGTMCAELKLSNSEGKLELSALEAERTRNIESVVVHVERLIGLARDKYTILSGTMPIEYLMNEPGDPTIEKIVTVCCALTNFCPSAEPFY